MLLLRRSNPHLRDEWCHVAGGIEPGEAAWQAALREVREETGLEVHRLFSADYTEQFYEAKRNVVTIVPAFVAYVDSTQPVRLNGEHSAFRWVTFGEAGQLVTFGGQRRLYEEVHREFVVREPSPWHEINILNGPGA
jgi:dihydroneopterin triphosphate diphosphatase